MKKTGKREVACLMLAYLAGMFAWGVAVPEAMEAARYLTLPVFSFAAGAWGLDAWAKQIRETRDA